MKSQNVSTWNELAACPAIGVDVSKKHLDIEGLCGSASYCRRIDNTAEALRNFKGTVL